MSEHHADHDDTVLAYARLKSGDQPFNRYGEGVGFARQAPKQKAAKGKPLHTAIIIDLAAERTKRAKLAK